MEKLNTNTVKDLRSLAKQRGLKGYSRLRKDELTQMLFGANITKPLNIMDEPIPSTGIALLIPQAVKRGVKSLSSMATKAAKKLSKKLMILQTR